MADKGHIIGIDPGHGGSLVVVDMATLHPVAIYDMPLHELRGRTAIDQVALVDLISYHRADTRFAIIERVGPAPRQGLASTFRFGEGYGVIQGVLSALNIQFLTVTPQAWKSAIGATADKNQSRELAMKIFPAAAPHLKRVKDDGRAEALLLASYGANIKDMFSAVDGTKRKELHS